MKTIKIIIALAAMFAASGLSAQSIKIKGSNGRFATVQVLSVEKTGMTVTRIANGPQVFVPWESVDLGYLATNYPEIDRQRQGALQGRQAEAIFTEASDEVTIASIKSRLVERLSAWDKGALVTLQALGDPNHSGHKSAVLALREGRYDIIDTGILPALQEAMSSCGQLPPSGASASFRDGIIKPAVRAAAEMRGAKVTKHEWIQAFGRLCDALGV